jgi:hypothetical protein
MKLLAIIFILVVFIVILIVSIVMQMRNAGIKVKDFMGFIRASQSLDDLYEFAKRYERMSPQQQIIYLAEAERMFAAFEKIPRSVWEEEQEKYDEVLDKYKDIRVMRWNEENALSTKVKMVKPREIKANN